LIYAYANVRVIIVWGEVYTYAIGSLLFDGYIILRYYFGMGMIGGAGGLLAFKKEIYYYYWEDMPIMEDTPIMEETREGNLPPA